jgi:hypothetical protein
LDEIGSDELLGGNWSEPVRAAMATSVDVSCVTIIQGEVRAGFPGFSRST